MNRTPRILATLVFVLIGIGAMAQVSIGLRGGYNIANVRATEALDNLAPDFDNVNEFSIAAITEIGITEQLSFQPELAYTRKGFGLHEDFALNLFDIPVPVGVRAESRFDYLEMPLLAKVKFGGPQFSAFVMAGPTLGYALDGQLTTKANLFFDIDVATVPIDLDAINYERFEVGGTVGAGIALNTAIGQFFADARYNHGFTELYDIPVVDEKVKNTSFGVNVGFLVPISSGSTRP